MSDIQYLETKLTETIHEWAHTRFHSHFIKELNNDELPKWVYANWEIYPKQNHLSFLIFDYLSIDSIRLKLISCLNAYHINFLISNNTSTFAFSYIPVKVSLINSNEQRGYYIATDISMCKIY